MRQAGNAKLSISWMRVSMAMSTVQIARSRCSHNLSGLCDNCIIFDYVMVVGTNVSVKENLKQGITWNSTLDTTRKNKLLHYIIFNFVNYNTGKRTLEKSQIIKAKKKNWLKIIWANGSILVPFERKSTPSVDRETGFLIKTISSTTRRSRIFEWFLSPDRLYMYSGQLM